MDNIEITQELNSVIDSLDISDNSLERVYMTEGVNPNGARYINHLVNEGSFHSFFTKYTYDGLELYSPPISTLFIPFLNTFNPYNSIIMDYKYILLKKENSN